MSELPGGPRPLRPPDGAARNRRSIDIPLGRSGEPRRMLCEFDAGAHGFPDGL